MGRTGNMRGTWCVRVAARQVTGTYGDGEFEVGVGFPWIALITNCSQMVRAPAQLMCCCAWYVCVP